MNIQVGSKVKIVKDTVSHRLPIGSIHTVDRVIKSNYHSEHDTLVINRKWLGVHNVELIEEESE